MDGLIFDFDGVIVDSEPLHYRAFREVFEPRGITFDYATYLQRYVGYDDRDMFRSLLTGADAVDEAELAALIAAKSEAFQRVVASGITALPGAVALIEAAADAPDLRLAIASGALADDIELIMPHVGDGGLLERFEAVVTADRVQRSKPHPETYRLAAELLGLEPARCVAIEDTEHGIRSAKGAGLAVMAVTNTQPAAELAEADRIVDSLEPVTLEDLHALVG